MVPEARMERTEHGVVPTGDGWWVVNTREAAWAHAPAFGDYTRFEGDVTMPQIAINLHLLQPGKPACMYHGEEIQENFLVLSGECILIVEGEERRLGPWDFVHTPAWCDHVFVGAGDRPCAVLMIGARPDGAVSYPVDPAAARHGACVLTATDSPEEAYAPFPASVPIAFPGGL